MPPLSRAPDGARTVRPHRTVALAWIALTVSCGAFATAPDARPSPSPAAAPLLAADTRITTTLETAWSKALQGNPNVKAAHYGVAATEGAMLQSAARPNPEMAFSQEDTRSETRSRTFQINQVIERGGKRAARMRIADSENAAAQTAVLEATTTLRYQVVTSFHTLLLAQQRVEFARHMHALALQATEAAQKRVQAGKVPPLEVSRAQVAQANAALELQQAQSSISVAQQQLAALWGGKAAEVGEAMGDGAAPAPVATADALEALVETAPALVQARHALAQSHAVSDLEQAKKVQDPTVSLGIKRASELGRNQVVVGFSIPLPLGDNNAGNQLQALRKVQQAEQKLQEQRLQLQTQVFAARQHLLGSHQQLAVLHNQVLPVAQSAYDVAVRGFTLGKFSFLDVLDAQRTLFDSQRQLLEQQMAAHQARAEIDRLLGTPALPYAPTGN